MNALDVLDVEIAALVSSVDTTQHRLRYNECQPYERDGLFRRQMELEARLRNLRELRAYLATRAAPIVIGE